MPDLRPLNYIHELRPGDTIVSLDGDERDYDAYTVTATFEGRATAVRSVDVTDPSQWLVLRSAPPEPTTNSARCEKCAKPATATVAENGRRVPLCEVCAWEAANFGVEVASDD